MSVVQAYEYLMLITMNVHAGARTGHLVYFSVLLSHIALR